MCIDTNNTFTFVFSNLIVWIDYITHIAEFLGVESCDALFFSNFDVIVLVVRQVEVINLSYPFFQSCLLQVENSQQSTATANSQQLKVNSQQSTANGEQSSVNSQQ